MSEDSMVSGSQAAAAAFVAQGGTGGHSASLVSICLEDGTVGLYHTDGKVVVELVAATESAFEEVELARSLLVGLSMTTGVEPQALLDALLRGRATHHEVLWRYLRSSGHSNSNSSCLTLVGEGQDAINVSASEWATAFERLVPQLNGMLDQWDAILRDAGLTSEVSDSLYVLSGKMVDLLVMDHVKVRHGLDPLLVTKQFPQDLGDGTYAELVAHGRDLVASGAIVFDRSITYDLSLRVFGGDIDCSERVDDIVLCEAGSKASEVRGMCWRGPVFMARDDCLTLLAGDKTLEAHVPDACLDVNGFGLVRISASVVDDEVRVLIQGPGDGQPVMLDDARMPVKGWDDGVRG